jgi:2-methylcitrate synthase/citrate synthase II
MAEEKMKAKKGLEGLIADESAVSSVDVEKKSLFYRGYNINDLCAKSSFLEVAYLLLHGELPTRAQFAEFEAVERDNREIPDAVYETFRKIPSHSHPMDYLRLGVSMVGLFDERNKYGENAHDENLRKARWMFAKMPTIVANSYRAVHGKEIIRPRTDLSYTQNFLYMLRGQPVTDELMVRTFDTTLMLYAEHGFNASTFSARVTASTLSDFYCAVDAAVATLKGPLHGGANEQVMFMLKEIGEPEKAEAYLLDALVKKKKIMGFGHRLYRKGDSRTEIIKNLGMKLAEKLGNTKWHRICQILEDTMMREKNIFSNLDFPVAPAYYLMDIPIDLYTPIFAASRITGWSGHIIEQHDNNRLIRPSSEYVGPKSREYVDIANR